MARPTAEASGAAWQAARQMRTGRQVSSQPGPAQYRILDAGQNANHVSL